MDGFVTQRPSLNYNNIRYLRKPLKEYIKRKTAEIAELYNSGHTPYECEVLLDVSDTLARALLARAAAQSMLGKETHGRRHANRQKARAHATSEAGFPQERNPGATRGALP